MPGIGSTGRRIKVGHFTLAVGWTGERAGQFFTRDHPNKFINQNVNPLRKGNLLDIIGIYQINSRDNVTVTLPISMNSFRLSGSFNGKIINPEQLIPSTQRANALGDLSIVYRHVLLPVKPGRNWNAVFAGGMVLPTGNFKATSIYGDGDNLNRQRKPVLHSIMPGQGGVGVYVEGQTFKAVRFPVRGSTLWLFGNYLMQPMGRNTTSSVAISGLTNSIPDQYLVRLGSFIPVPGAQDRRYLRGLRLFLGARWAGTPQHDFIGPNNGFRQPGMLIGAEPGFAYALGRYSLFVTAPIFFLQRSEADLAKGAAGNLDTIPRWVLNVQLARRY